MTRLLLLVLLLAPTAARADELTVFAAASLREAFEDLAKQLEARTPGLKVVVNFAGSQELRTQIEQGARADVFASADPKQPPRWRRRASRPRRRVFRAHELVVVVHADKPAGIHIRGAAKGRSWSGPRRGPGGPTILQSLDRSRRLQGQGPGQVCRASSTAQVLAKVALATGDAGVVYRTRPRPAQGEVDRHPRLS